jgi:hypothetical protein
MLIGPSGLKLQIHIPTRRRQLFLFLVKIVHCHLKPGDGLVYKGCERPHWRDKMPGAKKSKKLFGKTAELYYHNIFFHYVLQMGKEHMCYGISKINKYVPDLVALFRRRVKVPPF